MGPLVSYWILTLSEGHKGWHIGALLAICIATFISLCSYVLAFRQCRDMGCGAFLGVLYSYVGILGLVFLRVLMTNPSDLGWFPIVAFVLAIYCLPLIGLTGVGTYLHLSRNRNNTPNKPPDATGDSPASFFDETRPHRR